MKTTIMGIIITAISFFIACKRENQIQTLASMNVVNASIDAGAIKINYFGRPINWSTYTGSTGTINYSENQTITIFNIANDWPFDIVSALDTTKNIFNNSLPIESKGIYTLFTTGQWPSFDAIFIHETNIVYNSLDSAISIRFINLSPNSPTVNITLADNPKKNEFSMLGYKQITNFKSFRALKTIPSGSLTFQVRNASGDDILATYTIPATAVTPYPKVSTSLSRFKSLTLVIKGLAGTNTGINTYGMFPVNHY